MKSRLSEKQKAPDRKSIKELFDNIKHRTTALDLNLALDSPEKLPHAQIFEIFENTADEEMKLRVEESAIKILEKLLELPTYRNSHKYKNIEKFEEYLVRSIKKLFDATNEFVTSANQEQLSQYSPSWNIPIQAVTIDHSKLKGDYDLTLPGKTTGEPFIKKRGWEARELPRDAGFIIGIVNCETRDEKNSTVSGETLEQASIDDLEVFDTIHELERIFKSETQSIGLSTLKINKANLTIESSNDTAERILSHIEEERKSGKHVSSLALFIVSESYNLSQKPLTSVAEIYSTIPFKHIKEAGIEDVMIDIVSCNTAEIANDLIKLTQKHSAENQLKVSSVFHNGYIFNNITYCYLGKADYEKFLENKTTPQQFYESPENSPKNKKLIQIITPGLSNIYTDDVASFTATKEVAKKTKKCLIPTKIPQIHHGSSFIYCADSRNLQVGSETAAATENAVENIPVVTKQSVAESIRNFYEKLDMINQSYAFDKPSATTNSNFYQKMSNTTSRGHHEI